MKTVQIEKESIHNRIIGNDGKERSPKPFVAQFVLKKSKSKKPVDDSIADYPFEGNS
ncbi:hypothetical protein [Variovorax sp. W2I14]|uniref:hypothetical protein n=1 Tax=Variovorax sp. W2I14 TaxID=3042290 RepID=UPI003D1AEAFA